MLEVETQVEPSRWRVRVTPEARRAKVELMAHATEVEAGTRKTAAEPE